MTSDTSAARMGAAVASPCFPPRPHSDASPLDLGECRMLTGLINEKRCQRGWLAVRLAEAPPPRHTTSRLVDNVPRSRLNDVEREFMTRLAAIALPVPSSFRSLRAGGSATG